MTGTGRIGLMVLCGAAFTSLVLITYDLVVTKSHRDCKVTCSWYDKTLFDVDYARRCVCVDVQVIDEGRCRKEEGCKANVLTR